jgi:fumarate reductase subunit D
MEQNQQTSGAPQSQKSQVNVMALISYIGPLCLIPLLTKDQDEFVKFHMKQGLVLFILEVAASIIFNIIPILWVIGWIFNIAWLVLTIIGIMNVVKDVKKELPIIGQFAERIKV